jgi:DNA-binding transcriptional MerR regulator
MKIGDIARQTNVSKSIIRYYEGKGVLPRAIRDSAGYREYGDAELSRIRFVTGARRLGCSFPEIRAMIEIKDKHCSPPGEILDLLSHKIIEVEQEMERLKHIQSELERLRELGSGLTEGQLQQEF